MSIFRLPPPGENAMRKRMAALAAGLALFLTGAGPAAGLASTLNNAPPISPPIVEKTRAITRPMANRITTPPDPLSTSMTFSATSMNSGGAPDPSI